MLSKFQNQKGKSLNEFPWLFVKKLPFSFELPASPWSWSITVRTKCCKRLAWAFSRDTWIAEAGSRWLIKMRRVQCLVWLLQGDSGLWGHEVSGNAISFIKSPQRFHFSSRLRHSSVFLSAASQLKAEWRFPSEYIFFNPVLLNFLCYLQMFTSTFSLWEVQWNMDVYVFISFSFPFQSLFTMFSHYNYLSILGLKVFCCLFVFI